LRYPEIMLPTAPPQKIAKRPAGPKVFLIVSPPKYGTSIEVNVDQIIGRGNFKGQAPKVSGNHFQVKENNSDEGKIVIAHIGKNPGEIQRFGSTERTPVNTGDVIELFVQDVYYPVVEFELSLQLSLDMSQYINFCMGGFLGTCRQLSDARMSKRLADENGPLEQEWARMKKEARTAVWEGKPKDFLDMLTKEQMKSNGLRPQDIRTMRHMMKSHDEVDARSLAGKDFHTLEDGTVIDFSEETKARQAEERQKSEERYKSLLGLNEEEGDDCSETGDNEDEEEDEGEEDDEEDDDEDEDADSFVENDDDNVVEEERIEIEDSVPSSPILVHPEITKDKPAEGSGDLSFDDLMSLM